MCVVFIFEHENDKNDLKVTRMENTFPNILIP